jgi:hypothetical protein
MTIDTAPETTPKPAPPAILSQPHAPTETEQAPEIFPPVAQTAKQIDAEAKAVKSLLDPPPTNANWKPGDPYFPSTTPITDTLRKQGQLETPKATGENAYQADAEATKTKFVSVSPVSVRAAVENDMEMKLADLHIPEYHRWLRWKNKPLKQPTYSKSQADTTSSTTKTK